MESPNGAGRIVERSKWVSDGDTPVMFPETETGHSNVIKVVRI